MRLLAPLTDSGANQKHLDHVMRTWLRGQRLSEHGSTQRLPLPSQARQLLGALDEELDGLARVVTSKPSDDGGEGLVVELASGHRVESVLLPGDSLCVSTQVGCAVGCTFCSTGTLGLEKQLSAEEILAQVVLARRQRPVRRVVFMGMGEPAHNLEAVTEAIQHLGRYGDLGRKDLVFSTVGDPPVFDRLAEEGVRPALALSLHTTDEAKRRELLPRAPQIPPRVLLDAALDYADRVGHPLQLQWTLLAGVNDGDEESETLIEWIRGRRVAVNYIPFHPGPGLDHARVDGDRAHQLTRRLHAAGIIAKLRKSSGIEAGVACGQLRARNDGM